MIGTYKAYATGIDYSRGEELVTAIAEIGRPIDPRDYGMSAGDERFFQIVVLGSPEAVIGVRAERGEVVISSEEKDPGIVKSRINARMKSTQLEDLN